LSKLLDASCNLRKKYPNAPWDGDNNPSIP
jgi:hypothetical protein